MKHNSLIMLALVLSASANAQLNFTQVNHSGLSSVTFEMGNTELELGDIDGDGDLDIVTIGDHGSPNINATEGGIMVFKNGGTGLTWNLTKSGSLGYGGVALGDVNNDGKMDVGYAMHHNYSSTDFGDQLIEVALGNGSGTNWTPYDDNLATNGETYGMFGIDFADVNGDGLLDLGSNSFGCCAGIHIYKNNGNGTWTVTDGAVGGNSNKWLKFGDFNNDGSPDLATASELGVLWKNNGAGVFSSFETGMTSDFYSYFDIADVNNDGAKDFGIVSSNGDAKVYYYNAAQSKWISISSGLPASGCVSIELQDMNMDGKCDAVIWSPGSITVYLGDGSGNWTLSGTITIPETQLSAFVTGDLNHDGFGDIIYLAKTSAYNSDNVLKVYLNADGNQNLNILPFSPKGFECFKPGAVEFITWNSSVPSGQNATVQIEYSTAGSNGPWTTVVAAAPNSGTYQWQVPQVNSANCFLKYTISAGGSSQQVVMSNAFGIGTCTNPTSVNEVNEHAYSIYPSPFNNYTAIQSGFQGQVVLKVRDLAGRVIRSEIFDGREEYRFNRNDLAEGTYLFEMQSGGQSVMAKVVVVD